jgi:hypothetical protein
MENFPFIGKKSSRPIKVFAMQPFSLSRHLLNWRMRKIGKMAMKNYDKLNSISDG